MIGGGGEQKTLRLVAQYADACNVFGGADMLRHKFEVLRGHCDALGRDYDSIERSTLQSVRLAHRERDGDTPGKVVGVLGHLARAGAQHVILGVRDIHEPAVMELMARDVVPALHDLG